MPDKSRRIASRQAELHRRRVRRIPSSGPSSVLNEPVHITGPVATADGERAPAATATQATAPRTDALPRAQVYGYIRGEILRIGMFAALMTALLVAATVVVR